MEATLDHAYFPQIFVEVMAQCDFKTQKTMRLHSSWAKQEVDRHQSYCCSISVWLQSRTLEGVRDPNDNDDGENEDNFDDNIIPVPPVSVCMGLFPVDFQLRVRGWVIPSLWTNEKQKERNSCPYHPGELSDYYFERELAHRYRAHRVIVNLDSLWLDHIAALVAERDGVEYESPLAVLKKATVLVVDHSLAGDIDIIHQLHGMFPNPPRPVIPPSILQMVLVLRGSVCPCHTRLDHSCRSIYLDLASQVVDDDFSTDCSLSLNILNPHVQHLALHVELNDHATGISKRSPGRPSTLLSLLLLPQMTRLTHVKHASFLKCERKSCKFR